MELWMFDTPAPPATARLSYGPQPLHFGDLRLPDGPGPHPVVIVIHGGFWRAKYDLEHTGHLAAALTAQGYATWNIEYRRIGHPAGGWPGTFQDVALATDYLRSLASDYSLDLSRVITLGHSAGGHLALWLASRTRLTPNSPLATAEPLPLRAAVSLAGVSDLHQGYELNLSNGVVADFLGGSPAQVPERYAAASPAELLPLGLPQLLIHGSDDENVPFSISQSYYERASLLGDHVTLVPLPGAKHFEVIDPRSAEWLIIGQELKKLL